jgi:hypothetical protein
MTSHLAVAAKAELENDAFVQAITRMEEKWMDIIRYSATEDVAKREYAYRMLKTLGDFIDELKAMSGDEAHARRRDEAIQMMKQ